MVPSSRRRTSCKIFELFTDCRNGNFTAAAKEFAVDKDERQLGARRYGGTGWVEQIEIFYLHGLAEPAAKLIAGQGRNFTPGIFHAASAGHWRADDLDDNRRSHEQQPGLALGPQQVGVSVERL